MSVILEVVSENLSSKREHVFPRFEADSRFDSTWWHSGGAKSPVSYCRFLNDGEEVGRAKILVRAGLYPGYPSWYCPKSGVTEIELIEIRPDLRSLGMNFGRQAVLAIQQRYGEPAIALSLDEKSDGFWRKIGWIAHVHAGANSDFGTLFSSVEATFPPL